MDQCMDVICTIDQEGRFSQVGAASKQVWGYTPGELVGIKLIDLVYKEDVDKTLKTIQQVIDEGKTAQLESRFIRKDGSVIPILLSVRWDKDDHLWYCVARDTSELKQQQLELSEVNERLRYVIKATSDLIWDWDIKQNILYRGEGFVNDFGYEEDIELKSIDEWTARVHPEDREELQNRISELLENSTDNRYEESYRFLKADGEYAFILDRGYVIRDSGGTAVRMIGAMQDLTAFKKREERTRKFQGVISELATDRSLPKMELVEALAKVLEVSANTLQIARVNAWLLEGDILRCIASYESGKINSIRGEILKHNEIPTYFDEIKENRTIASTKAREDERLAELTDSYFSTHNVYSLLDTSVQTYGKAQAVVCHEAVGKERKWRDDEISFAGAITDQVAQLLANEEKKIKDRKLREALKEQETLLAEVHHRVKNNLAVISGMIQLQAFEETNESLKNKFMDWVSRISSIATIHEQLYQSESFSKLEFSENLELLTSKIIETIRSNTAIDLTLDLSTVELNINQALPCSMIVNEVITNIIQHAFEKKKKGCIWIVLKEDENQINLSIRDNGRKLPSDFDVTNPSDSMGLRLIDTLANQLSADYKYQSSEKGTTFFLQFKKAEIQGSGSAQLN